MTEDDDEKNQFSFRMVGACYGFVTLLSFPLSPEDGRWNSRTSVCCHWCRARYYCSCDDIGLRTLTKERSKPKRAEKFSFQQFADLVHNKAWLYMTAIAVCTNFFNGFRYAVAGYMFDYCLHGNVTIEGLIINYTAFHGVW